MESFLDAEKHAFEAAGYFLVIGLAIVLVAFLFWLVRLKNPKFEQWVKGIWPNEKQKDLLWVVVPLVIILFAIFK